MAENPTVINARGESQEIAKNLAMLGQSLRSLFENNEDRALAFYEENPQAATQLAIANRLAQKRAMATGQPFKAPSKKIAALSELIPYTPAEVEAERLANEQAFKLGQAKLAQQQLLAPLKEMIGGAFGAAQTGVGQQGTAPQMTPIQQEYGQLAMAPGMDPNSSLGAAPEAVKKMHEQVVYRDAMKSAKEAGLFDEKELERYEMYLKLTANGASHESAKHLLPLDQQQKIELEELTLRLDRLKDTQAADLEATPTAIKMGLVTPGFYPRGFPGAAARVADERQRIAADNRQRAMKVAEEREKGVLGTAMEIALANPGMKPAEIKERLMRYPQYKNIPDGVLSMAAIDAPQKVRNFQSPRNEVEANMRMVYGPARHSIATVIKRLETNPEGFEPLGWKARLAQLSLQSSGLVGAAGGIGAAAMNARRVAGAAQATGTAMQIGGFTGVTKAASQGAIQGSKGGIGGAIAGGIAGAAIGAAATPLLRGFGRAVMNQEEDLMWNLAQDIAAMSYRGESGKAVRPDEVRQAIERYFPLTTDSEATKAMKIVKLKALDQMMSDITGMPGVDVPAIMEQFNQEQDELLKQTGGSSLDREAPALDSIAEVDPKVQALFNGVVAEYGDPAKALAEMEARKAQYGAISEEGQKVMDMLKRALSVNPNTGATYSGAKAKRR